jgi:hypothetical protein
MNFCKSGSVNLGDYMNFAMNFCAGNLNECPFTAEIGHAEIFREFLY